MTPVPAPLPHSGARPGPPVRAWSHSRHTFPLGPRNRYPLDKYALLRERVVADGTLTEDAIDEPSPLPWAAVERVHDPAFVGRMRSGDADLREERVLGLQWSEQLIDAHAARDAGHAGRRRMTRWPTATA